MGARYSQHQVVCPPLAATPYCHNWPFPEACLYPIVGDWRLKGSRRLQAIVNLKNVVLIRARLVET